MQEEEFKTLFEKQKKNGASSSLLMQLRFSYELSAADEIYDLLAKTEDFVVREWIRLSAMEGMPISLIRTFPEMSEEQIRVSRKKYFYEKEGIQELQDAEAEVNRKLQKLQLLVDRTEPMEKFLNVILKQKDALIKGFQEQNGQAQEQIRQMSEQLKVYERKIADLKIHARTMPEKKAMIPWEECDHRQESNLEECPPVKQHGFSLKAWFRKNKKEAVADYLKNPDWNTEQMKFLIECLEEGLELKDIKDIADPKLSVEKMGLMKRALLSGRKEKGKQE